MAKTEKLVELQDVLTNISRLLTNFGKKGLNLRTSAFICKETQRLQNQFDRHKNLSANQFENPLIVHSCENFLKIYREYYQTLDNYLPFDANSSKEKSHSTEELNKLAVPENIDTFVGKLYPTQRALELQQYIREVTERLVEDFDVKISSELAEFFGDIDYLGRIVE